MIKGLILCGGKSTRFGNEKYLMEVNGKPQFIYLYDLLAKMEVPAYISCNSVQEDQIPDTYRLLIDEYEQIGPIGGISRAIEEDPLSAWLVLACDMPNIDEASVTQLMENRSSAKDIVTFQSPKKEFPETTFTIYESSSFSSIAHAIESASYSIQEVFKSLKIKTIPPISEDHLKNVNSREDLS